MAISAKINNLKDVLKPPLVQIGSMPIDAQLFIWSLKSGVDPYTTRVTVTKERAKELWSQGSPTQVKIKSEYIIGTNKQTKTKLFRGVYVNSFDDSDTRLTTFELSDRRWRWQGKRFTRRYNVKRRLNDAEIIEAGGTLNLPGSVGFRDFGSRDSIDIRQQYLKLPKHRYHEWSLNPRTSEAWTALEIAEDILLDEEQGLEPRVSRYGDHRNSNGYGGRKHGLTDNGYQPDEEMVLEEDAPGMLSRALQFARANIAVWPDGKVYLYPYDVGDVTKFLPANAPVSEESTILYVRNLDRVRPKRVFVRFVEEREVWFRYNRNNEGPEASYPIAAENYPYLTPVIQLPQNEDFPAFTWPNGRSQPAKKWSAGTYLPEEIVLAKWDVAITRDTVGGATNLRDAIRIYWFDGLANMYSQFYNLATYGRGTTRDPTPLLRVQAILENFGQTFMLNEWWVERLGRLKAERVGILNNVNGAGQRIPSPVFLDWMYMLNTRPGKSFIDEGQDWGAFNISSFEDEDGNTREDEDLEPAPFKINIVDKQLGIIRITPYTDKQGAIFRSLPFQAANPENMRVSLMPGNNMVAGCAAAGGLDPSKRFETILSVTLATKNGAAGNSEEQWYTKEVGYPGKADHDYYSFMSMRDTARFTQKRNNNGEELLNERLLSIIATNEAWRIWDSITNVWLGFTEYEGLYDIVPFGHATSVSWVVDANGVATTRANLNKIPVPPDILLSMPKRMRRYLQGAIVHSTWREQ